MSESPDNEEIVRPPFTQVQLVELENRLRETVNDFFRQKLGSDVLLLDSSIVDNLVVNSISSITKIFDRTIPPSLDITEFASTIILNECRHLLLDPASVIRDKLEFEQPDQLSRTIRDRLVQAISSLPQTQQDVLRLRYLEERPVNSIRNRLNLEANSVVADIGTTALSELSVTLNRPLEMVWGQSAPGLPVHSCVDSLNSHVWPSCLGNNQLIKLKRDIDHSPYRTLIDLWDDTSTSVSHWMYLFNDIDIPEENSIFQQLAKWKFAIVGDTASISCLGATDHNKFTQAFELLEIKNAPVLIMGLSPSLDQHVIIKPSFLMSLANSERLISLLNCIHTMAQNKHTMKEICKYVGRQRCRRSLELTYKEIKDARIFRFRIGG